MEATESSPAAIIEEKIKTPLSLNKKKKQHISEEEQMDITTNLKRRSDSDYISGEGEKKITKIT